MNSSQLRRIVEAMTGKVVSNLGSVRVSIRDASQEVDDVWFRDHRDSDAFTVLANHATVLVGLLDACEHLQSRGELPPVLDAWVRSAHAIGGDHG